MADKHNDLDDLIQVWKSGDTPNTGNFKKYINFFRLKTMALLAAEGVVSVIAVVIGLYQCFYGSLLLGVSILIFAVATFCLALWARKSVWHLPTGSVKDELLASIKLARAQYRWAWGGIWACALALIFMTSMIYTYSTDDALSLIELRKFLVKLSFALIFIAVSLVMTTLILEKSRRRLVKLKILYEQLRDPKL